MELTINEAKKSPANFMYIWADEQGFLSHIEPQYAAIIRGKKANQKRLIALSARKYLGSEDKWEQYAAEIKQAFIATYGITPEEALVALAQGKTVAGKNWKAGIFGIGGVKTFSLNSAITVDTKTGAILKNGKAVKTRVVYSAVGGKTVPYQYFYTDTDGRTYMSQRVVSGIGDPEEDTFAAAAQSTASGEILTATGEETTAANSGTIWESIVLIVQKVINWLISMFGDPKKEMISAENTLPSQETDGFVSEAGVGEGAGLLLLLAAGGALIATGSLGGKKGKKSKK